MEKRSKGTLFYTRPHLCRQHPALGCQQAGTVEVLGWGKVGMLDRASHACAIEILGG